LMKDGVAFLAGIDAGLAGIQAAVDVGAAWKRPISPPLLAGFEFRKENSFRVLDEAESKDFLKRVGVPIPSGKVVRNTEEAVAAAAELGYPVVVKALGVAHKTESGAVRLDLGNAEAVLNSVKDMLELSESFLVEKMIDGAVAELIIGVARDEQFGPYLLVGGGGIMVELMRDSASILLPTTAEYVSQALGHLKCAPLFNCFRGCQPADLDAAVDIIMKVAGMVEKDPSSIIELDINPLMILPDGQGVVAADALISLNAKSA